MVLPAAHGCCHCALFDRVQGCTTASESKAASRRICIYSRSLFRAVRASREHNEGGQAMASCCVGPCRVLAGQANAASWA